MHRHSVGIVNYRYSVPQISERIARGAIALGLEEVRTEFERNFRERGELGAACAAYYRGELVVDLWGGYRDVHRQHPWEEDTLVGVFSTTKGLASMTLALAHSRGLIDFDTPVAEIWPEFAQHGKDKIMVRQLLSHQAGLSAIGQPLTLDTIRDPDALAEAIAKQKCAWEPGTRHGYHGISLGWYAGELIRRVDPQSRTLGQFFQQEIAQPLGLEFYIGLPDDIPDSRIAEIQDFHPLKMLLHLNKMPGRFVAALMNPWSLTSRSLMNPRLRRPGDLARGAFRHVEMPAANGIGSVRSVAKAYSEFATGGKELGLSPNTLRALQQPAQPPSGGNFDQVLRIETSFSLGYMKPFPRFQFASSDRAYGTPGMGGSFAFADPENEIGFAYAPNRSGYYLWDDPREAALRRAMYRCIERFSEKSIAPLHCLQEPHQLQGIQSYVCVVDSQ